MTRPPAGVIAAGEGDYMQIILLLDHKALIRDDRKPTVSIHPNNDGQERVTMEFGGKRFELAEGSPNPSVPDLIGHVGVTVYDRNRIKYTAKSPRMVAGGPYSAVDFAAEFYDMALLVDRQAREIEAMRQEIRGLAANVEHNSTGHLNIGEKKEYIS